MMRGHAALLRIVGRRRMYASDAASKGSVGFIGLGNMGAFMAENLHKAGHRVAVFDINDSAVERLTRQGAMGCATPKAVADACDTVITMLPSNPHVQSVYKGEDGILQAQVSSKLLIDASTIDPNVAREVSQACVDSGAEFLDAPVSGGVLGAENGTLTFMVGGAKDTFDRASGVLHDMGKNVVHCGAVGNGQVAKVCNNMALGIQMVATSEALTLGVKLGIDPKLLASIMNTSTSRCWSSDTYNPCPGVMDGVPASRGYTGGFGSALMLKDLGLATGAAVKAGAAVPLGQHTELLYQEMVANGYSDKDFGAVFEYLHKKGASPY